MGLLYNDLMLKLLKFSNKAIPWCFYLLFFFTPLVLTPYNYELFEFNKMVFVYFMATFVVFFWGMKMLLSQKLFFRRTPFDIPIALFFLSQLLSTLFSIDLHTSLWGYYSRFHGGLFSTISYLVLYYALVSNLNKKEIQKVLSFLFSGALIVSLYGILEHFGIDAKYWVQDVKDRVFSTLGQPNWLAAYLLALIPLTWAKGMMAKNSKEKILYYTLNFIFSLCLFYTRSRSGLLALGTAFVVFWGGYLLVNKAIKGLFISKIFIFGLIIFVLALFVGTPWNPSVTKWQISNGKFQIKPSPPVVQKPIDPSINISESSDIREVVWKGAIGIWKHYPIFGSGVETFAYSYYQFRPREHNDLSEWDFLYNKAHNEYLNFAATTGTVGLGSYLLLIAWLIVWSLRNISKSNISLALLAGYASILVTNFFGFSVVIIGLFFFLFQAISYLLVFEEKKETVILAKKMPQTSILLSSLLFALSVYLLYTFSSLWYADTLYATGEKENTSGDYSKAFVALQKAIQIRSGEPIYHDEISLSAANLAVMAWDEKEATFSSQLAEVAVNESKIALKTSPYNLSYWKDQTKVFYSLATINKSYNQQALGSLLQATELAPTDAKIRYNLGLIYYQLGQEEQAIKTVEEAITLKPNYEAARYALALFYEGKGDKQKEKEQLKYILEKINPGNQSAKDKLKEIK